MVFSSILFLFRFLPVFMICYFAVWNKHAPRGMKNIILFLGSLIFYAWGEPVYVLLMLFSTVSDYIHGRAIDALRGRKAAKWLLVSSLVINLAMLGFFKYADFLIGVFNSAAGTDIGLLNLPLPIGISFYTFQTMSYTIDVYRGEARVQKNLLDFGVFVTMFPQLIAGPIVKYTSVQDELHDRRPDIRSISRGCRRFTVGLAKKVLLANNIGLLWEEISSLQYAGMNVMTAWMGILAFAFQIYFDFSGYSDMAIGLGKMFGFDFMENFNYPYLSSSIKEFWRRWHISLSTWFREYLYIPLGGNRKGVSRTYVNLILVFFATGLWHGAGGNFVLWGMFHGFFIVAERAFLGKLLEKNPIKFLNHVYALLVVVIGWLMFRVESLGVIRLFLQKLFLPEKGAYQAGMFMDNRILFWTVAGILLCGPVQALCPRLKTWLYDEDRVRIVDFVMMAAVVGFCTILLVNNTYNPFIYFRF